MTRFLFTTLPTDDLGLLARSLPIARALVDGGHDVRFSSAGRAPMRLVADAGFVNVLPRHPIFDLLADEPSLRGMIRLLSSRGWRSRYSSRRQILRQLVPALPRGGAPGDVPPWNADHAAAQMGMSHAGFVRACTSATVDLLGTLGVDVVVDCWNPFAAIAARALGTPLVTVIQADAHPASAGFMWWRPTPPNLPSPVPTINLVLGELGLPAVSSFADLSVGDLTLVVGSPLTDPLPPDAPVTYIGPAVWPSPGAALPHWVERLGRDRPLVWVYSGNPRYGGPRRERPLDSAVIVRASVAALAEVDVDVVLTTGHHELPRDLRVLPANMHHAAYLPGLALAERSHLLIHHGGHGSCQTGLLSGTPAVIMPTYAERECNARRVESLGAGRVVPVEVIGGRKRVEADRLRRTVFEVLADPSMRDAARRLGRHLSSFGGPPRAADLITAFAQQAVDRDRHPVRSPR